MVVRRGRQNIGLFWAISIIFGHSEMVAAPDVHVVLAQKLQEIDIEGLQIKRMLIYQRELKEFSGQKILKFNCKKVPPQKGLLAMVTSPSGILDWNGQKYQGELLIVGDEQGDYCQLVNRISIESYLAGLLPKEMNKSWPIEALKAQAVVARTYALYKIQQRKKSPNSKKIYHDLINSEMDQVSGSLLDSSKETRRAVILTQGEILTTKEGERVPTFFHSKCGGRTLLPEIVWQNRVNGYQTVECPYCQQHGKQGWTYKMTLNEFKQLLQKIVFKYYKKSIAESHIIDWKEDSFLKDFLYIKDKQNIYPIKKTLLRRMLGREKMSGNYIQISKQGADIIINGEGNGHGVGMCQFGALHLAQGGRNYKEILNYYFPLMKIDNAYE